MKIFNSIFDSIVKFSQNKNIGHIQNVCGTTAMLLSCMAFTGSVLFNKGIPKEQKEFLVSQELADGAINVSLFWFMTSKFNKWAIKQVNDGKIFPKNVKEEVLKIKSKLGEKAKLEDIKEVLSKEGLENVEHFEKSFPALVSLSGSLLAASIVTPIVRNIIASKFQNRKQDDVKPLQAKETTPQGNIYVSQKPSPQTVLKKPVSPAYNAFQARSSMRV